MLHPGRHLVSIDPLIIFATHAALLAIHECGLLQEIAVSPRTAAEYAQQLKLDAHTTECVLELLAASGILEKDEDRYQITSDSEVAAIINAKWLLMLHEQFLQTARLLRTGERRAPMSAADEQRVSTYTALAADLGKLYADLAAFLAGRIDRQPERILDVGCGSGVWSLAIAARCARSRVVGLDLPEVLEAFTSLAQKMCLSDRIETLPGDMHKTELAPESFDLVVIANVLRLESAERASRLLRRLGEALRPGGRLLVIDSLAAGTPAKDLERTAYALHLALRSDIGRVHSMAQIRQWISAAGLLNPTEIDCGVHLTAVGAIWADRPSVLNHS